MPPDRQRPTKFIMENCCHDELMTVTLFVSRTLSTIQVTLRFGSIPPQFRGKTLWVWSEASHLSSPSTNHTRGLATRRLFSVPPCRAGTIHLQTTMSSPGFEPSPYGTAVSVANHYTGWATGPQVPMVYDCTGPGEFPC
ncbi:hypothetical protein TNCV_1737551 [Trichonephila clavipes]|nr:hypothetical protein TNCV_1737551 [Trichonephila clavipes]